MTTADTEDVFDTRPEVQQLFRQLKDNLANLEQLLERCSDMWGYDDVVYRFYHQSFKVFRVQESTRQIVDALHALAPDRELNPWFTQIVADGTGHQFTLADNRRWLEVARPILEAYFPCALLSRDGGQIGPRFACSAAPPAERMGGIALSLRSTLRRFLGLCP